MRRYTLVLLLGIMVMLVGGVGATGGMSAREHQGVEPKVATVQGSWQMMGAGAPGTPPDDPLLATFSPDGTVTLSARAVRPALPGMPFAYMHFSTGHGAWQDGDDGTTSFTIVHLRSDETGVFRGSITFSGILALGSDGQSVTGEATYTVRDPSGTVVSVIPTSLDGQRIVVEALAEVATSEG